jgi:hypothetical protein
MSKIDKVEKFGVHAYVVNLIQICTALALASDHLQIWQTHLWKATFMPVQRYETISEHNFLKIANFQFHPLTVSRKITHTQ